MRRYELTLRAARDLEAAAEWYNRQTRGLGRQFVDSFVQAMTVACSRPSSCPEIERGVRGIRCIRFPYRIHFEVHPDKIDVLAIYHTARNPQEWNESERQ